MKKLVSILCAGAMLLSLAACGAEADTTYAGQTITGKVTALEGTSVTLALGELTEDAAPGGDSQQPPEMPSDGQTGDQPTGTPPEKPERTSGDNQSGQQPPEMPENSENGQPDGTPPDMPEGGMGGSSFTESGETLTIDITNAAIVKNGETISSTELAVDDVVQVTFDDSGSAATVEIVSGGKGGGFGGFGGSSQVTQGDSANTISEDGTYTGTTYTSTGDDENALRVDGGSYVSNGYNSHAVYSTADITVKNAFLTANNSEALVIEGKNSIVLENCTVTGNMSDTKGSSSEENVHNVMIYQSMSGDADVGTSTFSMTGGTLTAKNGDMIYVTNTHCVLTLSGVTIKNEDAGGALLRVVGNSASHGWGTAGSNGAQVEFTADNQTLNGDIVVDTISTLNMTLTNGSSFTGTINIVDNAQNGTAVSNNAVVTIESGCTWTLTGDCVITSLTNSGTINFNGYTITLADGTVLR